MTLLAEHDHHFRTDEPGTTDDDDLHLEPCMSEEWKELWSKSLAAVRQGRGTCTAMSRATLSSGSVRNVASTTSRRPRHRAERTRSRPLAARSVYWSRSP